MSDAALDQSAPPALNSRGYPEGHRELWPSAHRETKAWRALVSAHRDARDRLNKLLPPSNWAREKLNGAAVLADHRDFHSPVVQDALLDYRRACLAFLDYPNPKPRHLLTLIRVVAEAMGQPDPCWSEAHWGQPISRSDLLMTILYHRVRRALIEGGMDL